MKFFYIIIILVFKFSYTFSQNTIGFLVLEKVNHLRDSLSLSSLRYDDLLTDAAKDHAYYMASNQTLTHFQKTFSKETVSERVVFYKGNRTYVGENVAYIQLIKDELVNIKEDYVAEKLYQSWLNSPPHYKNMISKNYSRMGLAFSIDKTSDRLYSTQVFSSNEIKLPTSFINSDISWGVRPSEKTCKDKPQTYETMFFANSVQVVENEIFLFFHDLAFFKNVIANENDGLAVDIILREQLPCNKENQFHISAVHDGEMQRPIYKNDIYRNNVSNNPKKIKVKIGEVPKYLQNKKWEPNIIIINDNNLCDYSCPIEIPSGIIPLIPLKPYYHITNNLLISEQPKIRISDSIHVELIYQRSKKSFSAINYDEYLKFYDWNKLLKNITINCYASVEGKTWFNNELLLEREKIVKQILLEANVDISSVTINLSENWELMNKQIKENKIKELESKSPSQIKTFLKFNPSPFFDSLLLEQRKTHITAKFDTTIEINSFERYILASQYDSSISLNTISWNKVLIENHLKVNYPASIDLIDFLSNDSLIKTNLLGVASIDETPTYIDSITVLKLTNNLDTSDSKQIFNYAHFLTKYWFSKYSSSYEVKKIVDIISPDELIILVQTIDTTIINSDDIFRLQINILLSGIHYYVAHNNWNSVNYYFKKISEIIKLNDLTPEEAHDLSLFCNYFHKFKISIEVLAPLHSNKTLTEDGYFLLAKTSTLIRKEIDEIEYRSYMESAKNANKNRYCNWINANFQILRDEYIKKDYCFECL